MSADEFLDLERSGTFGSQTITAEIIYDVNGDLIQTVGSVERDTVPITENER